MKIIPPNSQASETIEPQIVAGTQVHRRIEITLEREIVSVLVRGRVPASPGKSADENPGPASDLVELPPPAVE